MRSVPKWVRCDNCRFWSGNEKDWREDMGRCFHSGQYVNKNGALLWTERYKSDMCPAFRKTRWYDWLYWWLRF